MRAGHSHNTAYEHNLVGQLDRLMSSRFDHDLTHRFACSQRAGEMLYGKHPFTVLPNGIMTDVFALHDPAARAALRAELGVQEGEILFGHVGRFCEQKNHAGLLRIFAGVSRRMPNARLVLIGTGDMRVEECIAMSNFAFEQGADGVMVVGPWYFTLTDADVMSYFGAVAEQVRGKVYIYNYPDRTGYSISPSVVLELARRYPNIVGIKDTIPDMAHTVELIQTVKSNIPSFESSQEYK